MSVKVKVNETPYDLPKDMTVMEAQILNKRLGHKVKASVGRKKPRNPRERETLLRWERQRGGSKIGDI